MNDQLKTPTAQQARKKLHKKTVIHTKKTSKKKG